MKKKVLFVITKATWGGAQKYVFDLATHLPKSEFEPVVAYGERGRLAELLEHENIKTHQISTLRRDIAVISDVSSFFKILVYLWRERPDIAHLNSSKAAALGALAARLAGVPKIVFTVHGWSFNEKRNLISRVPIYFISWFSTVLSHAVIVVSKSDETQGKDMWFVKNKIHYIPIGIEPLQLLFREEASASLSISTTVPRIVTIAELTANKGVQYAIGAIALLKKQNADVSYSIIGDGEERTDLVERARELRVADRVHFLGFIPDASKYLKAFDVFLLPSIKEGMPYVLLEAAGANLPIVTTNVVNPDVVDRYENIRAVPPADPEAIANAIVETLKTPSEAPLFPGKHFQLADMFEKTLTLYR